MVIRIKVDENMKKKVLHSFGTALYWIGFFILTLIYPPIGDFLMFAILFFALISILYCCNYYIRKFIKRSN